MADDDNTFHLTYKEYRKEEKAIKKYIKKLPELGEIGTEKRVRPSFSDNDQKIGFFTKDSISQTEVSEVVEIKELTAAVQQLLDNVTKLKRDLNLTKSSLQADYDAKLKTKSIELYCRINEKVNELESVHAERMSVVRKAFQTQLSDALARAGETYSEVYAKPGSSHSSKRDDAKNAEKMKNMQMTIYRQEAEIRALKTQVEDLEKSLMEKPKVDPTTLLELEDAKNEVKTLKKKVGRLEDALDAKEEMEKQLKSEIEVLQQQVEEMKKAEEKLREALSIAKEEAEKAKINAQKQLEAQRQQWLKEVDDKIRNAREEATAKAKKDAQLLIDAEREKYDQLMAEKLKLEEQLAKEKADRLKKDRMMLDADKLRKSEERLQAEVARLKKEIERLNRMWEKKFAILQQSLHALKDESFIRQQLQRQATTLHQAAVSYAADMPASIQPRRQEPTEPDTKEKKRVKSAEKEKAEMLSYTVSAPSGRGTGLFSLDENQVMSDGEQDLPEGAPAFPPPSRGNSDCAIESRPISNTSLNKNQMAAAR